MPDDDKETKTTENNDNGGFTEAQLKVFGGMINAAITNHNKHNSGPSFEEQLNSINWAEKLGPVIQGLIPKPDDDAGNKGKKPELSDYEKQLAKLTNDLEASNRRAAEAESKRIAAETARRNDAGRTRLRNALNGQVLDGALDHVVNHLTVVSNRLIVDEDGNVKLKVKRPELPGFPPTEQEVNLEDGIKDILSESEMKIFIPATRNSGGDRSSNGSGAKVTSASFKGEATTDAEKASRAIVREQEMASKYGYR